MKAAVVGIAGPSLAAAEAAMLRAHRPAGVILFARNIADPLQLVALTESVRAALPAGAVLMVDQEGGRVARLRPPHWDAHPAAAILGLLYRTDKAAGLRAAWITGALIGHACAACGFDVVCAPVLDVAHPETHAAIGDRAFSADPSAVGLLGGAVAAGLLAAGVQPVMKHLPGHGRASVDSHAALPRVADADLDDDFAPFAVNAGTPWAITAHILYAALDPAWPATLSPSVIAGVIRTRIGFDGVLMSDDLAMQALSGAPADLARRAIAAGCDLALFCTGEPAATASMLAACPPVTAAALARMEAGAALATRCRTVLDAPALAAERARLFDGRLPDCRPISCRPNN